ncbi:hypothetical protein MHBO_003614 [Bonamia ostreae]|uniref:BACK domain-containing protein n=1 Tax=Bonamia ostreae TaxID=126728 RepID=A0ABV2AR17_9EUKA
MKYMELFWHHLKLQQKSDYIFNASSQSNLGLEQCVASLAVAARKKDSCFYQFQILSVSSKTFILSLLEKNDGIKFLSKLVSMNPFESQGLTFTVKRVQAVLASKYKIFNQYNWIEDKLRACDLPMPLFIELISFDHIDIMSENEVWIAASYWISSNISITDLKSDSVEAKQIFSVLRLHLMDKTYLSNVVCVLLLSLLLCIFLYLY